MGFRLIVTLGPSLNNPEKLKAISSLGSCIFRINGAHVMPDDIQGVSEYARSVVPDCKLLLDLPGNKIRTSNLSAPIRLIKGETFELFDYQLNFPELYKYVQTGDVVFANDSIFKMEVVKIVGKKIKILSHSDGLLGANKGFHIKGISNQLPFLFSRDKSLIEAAVKNNLSSVSLSFVRTSEDVLEAKKLLSSLNAPEMELFVKIETAMALEHLSKILEVSSVVNVDRGDLSSDIGLINLPNAQDRIIKEARKHGKPIFLATQFLKNMENNPVPLIAEIMDLYKTIHDGISGIQLSEETAVGKYPVECAKTVFDVVSASNNKLN
jgi:pyruvate kinase